MRGFIWSVATVWCGTTGRKAQKAHQSTPLLSQMTDLLGMDKVLMARDVGGVQVGGHLKKIMEL